MQHGSSGSGCQKTDAAPVLIRYLSPEARHQELGSLRSKRTTSVSNGTTSGTNISPAPQRAVQLRTILTTPHTPSANDAREDTVCGEPLTMSLNTIGAGTTSMPKAVKYVKLYAIKAASGLLQPINAPGHLRARGCGVTGPSPVDALRRSIAAV